MSRQKTLKLTAPIKLMLQKSEQIFSEYESNDGPIRHRIWFVLQRSYTESHEEGIISLDSFIILKAAISSCNELVTYSYGQYRNSLTQRLLFKQLSLVIDVLGIECIHAIAKHEMLEEIGKK